MLKRWSSECHQIHLDGRVVTELDKVKNTRCQERCAKELNTRGFHGRGFTTIAIGSAMKSMGFEAKKMRGTYKYIAVLADFDRQQRERKQDAAEDTIMPF